jgi:hypothetical protein
MPVALRWHPGRQTIEYGAARTIDVEHASGFPIGDDPRRPLDSTDMTSPHRCCSRAVRDHV